MRGVCVYCVWMSEGQIKETYIICLKPAVFALLLFQSTQTEHLQRINVLVNNQRRGIKDLVHFYVYLSVAC